MNQLLYYLLVPGIVVHELSHLIAVLLTPNVKIDEIDLTSNINHSGRYTITRLIFISYAPLVVNSVLSFSLFYSANKFINNIYLYFAVVFLGLSICMSALPSHQDAVNPMLMLEDYIKNIRISYIPFLLTFGVFYCVFSIPIILITYLKDINNWTNIVFSALFTVFIVSISFNIIDLQSIAHLILSVDFSSLSKALLESPN